VRIEPLKLLPAGTASPSGSQTTATVGGKSFSQIFSDALDNVNNLQQEAKQASTNLATGKIQDLSEVTIAAEKATIALQLTVQVRNKVLEAYNQVMQMQV